MLKGWMAMACPTTVGRRATPSVVMIVTFGWLMIAAEAYVPSYPGLLIVRVEPVRSSGLSLPRAHRRRGPAGLHHVLRGGPPDPRERDHLLARPWRNSRGRSHHGGTAGRPAAATGGVSAGAAVDAAPCAEIAA
jgi:hypothetical protein